MGFFGGVDHHLMGNHLKKLFFDEILNPICNKKSGKSSPTVLVPYRNRSGVVELVWREPLIIARVENGVTKYSPKRQKTPPKKKKDQEQQFSVGNFHFLQREN